MKKVVVQQGQSLYDIAMQEYSGPQGVFWLQQDNPAEIPDLDFDPPTGTVLYIRENTTVEQVIEYAVEVVKPVYRKVIAEEGQNLFDLVTQEYGSIEYVFDFLSLNPGIDINTKITAGQQFRILIQQSESNLISKYFSDRKIKVGTGEKKSGSGDFNSDFNSDFF